MKLPPLFYDSHLNCDVLSASSHHIKAGVTSFTTLTKCKLLTNDHRDTEGNLRESKRRFPNPRHTSAVKPWSLEGYLPTSAHSSPVLGDSLQPRDWTPQHSAAKTSHQVLVFISQSRNCWGLQEEAASVRTNVQSRCYRRQEIVFITSVVRVYKAIDRLAILGITQKARGKATKSQKDKGAVVSAFPADSFHNSSPALQCSQQAQSFCSSISHCWQEPVWQTSLSGGFDT